LDLAKVVGLGMVANNLNALILRNIDHTISLRHSTYSGD